MKPARLPHDTRLFVVRVWQDGPHFRAAVRSADDAPPLLFTAAPQLTQFLNDAAAAEPQAAPASGPANAASIAPSIAPSSPVPIPLPSPASRRTT